MSVQKDLKSIMVIMPFRNTPTRGERELNDFFKDILKKTLETKEFQNRYKVMRSEDQFNITTQIVTDLFESDIVICDLSGSLPNPNVMYELGMRLSLSDKPVILIREEHQSNQGVFDISGFYTFEYDSNDYTALKDYLIQKISRFESGEEVFRSPVRDILASSGAPITGPNTPALHAVSHLGLGLRLVAKGYYARVTEFIADHDNLKRPSSDGLEMETIQWFLKHHDTIDGLDWSTFDAWPTSNPLIDTFWSCAQLRDLVPEPVYMDFLLFMVNYHQDYFSIASGWDIQPAAVTMKYLADTISLLTANDYLKALLIPEGRRHSKEISQKLIEYLRTSDTSGYSS